MKFTVLTLFPQLIDAFRESGLVGQALKRGDVELATLNPRAFTEDAHHTVDDRVFGGGDGMVLKYEPLARAVDSLSASGPLHVAVMSPQGKRWDQSMAKAWSAQGGHIVLVCGRYAGIDHRFTTEYADEEISLGDFILNGGEIAACAVIESVVRLRPGVLGNALSCERDSFSDGFLECPQFTRPQDAGISPVPAPLLSGNHAEIATFEKAVGRVRTALLRPDLLERGAALQKDMEIVARLNDHELQSLGLDRGDLFTVLGEIPS